MNGPLHSVVTGGLTALVDLGASDHRGDAEGPTSRQKPSARGSRVEVGEAEFDEAGAHGHLCACCRHRCDGSNCTRPLFRKLQMKRRGRGDEERTSIEVARCFVLALTRADASRAS